MPTHLLTTLSILALALLLAGAEPARADGGHAPGNVIDGYTVTLTGPEDSAQTGNNAIVVTIHDSLQRPLAGATVTASLLAYLPGEGGHGETHSEAAPADTHSDEAVDTHAEAAPITTHSDAAVDTHSDAAADTHNDMTTDAHGDMTTDAHGEAAPADTDSDEAADTHATDGQGLAATPISLVAGDEPGVYRGELGFDQPGTWTVGVVFTIDGEERGTTFEVAVAQSRPRGLVLGGFALVNGLAIASAAVLKRRTPTKSAAKPVVKPSRPVSAATTITPEE